MKHEENTKQTALSADERAKEAISLIDSRADAPPFNLDKVVEPFYELSSQDINIAKNKIAEEMHTRLASQSEKSIRLLNVVNSLTNLTANRFINEVRAKEGGNRVGGPL